VWPQDVKEESTLKKVHQINVTLMRTSTSKKQGAESKNLEKWMYIQIEG
jgi:hypothetical protein